MVSKIIDEEISHRDEESMDRLIIENLACLEINELILQPPFHLVGNIALNDKGISYDGEILVYNSNHLTKENAVGEVKIQIKGTTTYKKVHKKSNIKHQVEKSDLENYYKFGGGVLYFVVTINKRTNKRQAYYKILAPLDLKALLLKLDNNKKNSISVEFKKLEKGSLESLCKLFIKLVRKQPTHFIEFSEHRNFTNYKIDISDINSDSSDLFDSTAYVYGFTTDNLEIPISVVQLDKIKRGYRENIALNNEEINIYYEIVETERSYEILVENTLSINLKKGKKGGSFKLGRLQTLGSYMKSLKIINYFILHGKLPFNSFDLEMSLDNPKKFKNIEEHIKNHQELITVCKQIGLNENYVFNKEENLSSLFNGILDIFKNKKYNLLKIKNEQKLLDMRVYAIDLSDYVRVRLLFTENKFYNFYNNEILSKVGGLIPKGKLPKEGKFPLHENWENYYQKVSYFSILDVEDIEKDANFNFEVVKSSFSDTYHDFKTHQTIVISLVYINYYIKYHNEEFLDFALDLNNRHLLHYPENHIPKINTYLIKILRGDSLSAEEQTDIIDIGERAESAEDTTLMFACEVLLGSKEKARRKLNNIGEEERKELMKYPIYHQYQNLN
ncbi:DUF4365 domain-containing protein [Bacillus pumilus]|uniref:DUF4365 domain-containing protein n=1 Tax=Bacillus pumilus TaxID=1408 RepID=UPI000FDC9142|nr:DUF4365 domain-containing protein [Bacillus pumilus]AZV54797.1 DUF4365 domain-containing protein [Bacillus pumilus]